MLQKIKYLRRQKSALEQFLISLDELEEVSCDLFDDIVMCRNEGEDTCLIAVERAELRLEAITQELYGLEYLLYLDDGHIDQGEDQQHHPQGTLNGRASLRLTPRPEWF